MGRGVVWRLLAGRRAVIMRRKLKRKKGGRVTTAVVFDLGGVLIDWNPRHLYRRLFNGDAVAMEHFLAHICTPEWNHQQDLGRTWADAVAERSARFPEHTAMIRLYAERWDEMVAGAIETTVEILEALKAAGWPLYSVTNFSAETFPRMVERFPFLQLFDGIIVSGVERVGKPDRAIYRILFERYRLDPGQCLFIDDVAVNVTGSEAAGMPAIHYRSSAQLAAELAARDVLTAPERGHCRFVTAQTNSS